MTEQLTETEKRLLAKYDRAEARVGPTITLGAALMLLGASIAAWQTFIWLKSADWPELSFGEALTSIGGKPLHFSWAGVQQIVDWIAAAPASTVIFFTGMVVMWSIIWGEDAPETDELVQAKMKRARIETPYPAD